VLAQSGAGQTLELALGSALIAGVAMGILCLRERHIR